MTAQRLSRIAAGIAIVTALGVAGLVTRNVLWLDDPDASLQRGGGKLLGDMAGYVGRVDREARTVDISASPLGIRPVVLLVTNDTAIVVNGKQGAIGDLWKDLPVRVFYELFGDAPETILFLPPWAINHSRFWKGQDAAPASGASSPTWTRRPVVQRRERRGGVRSGEPSAGEYPPVTSAPPPAAPPTAATRPVAEPPASAVNPARPPGPAAVAAKPAPVAPPPASVTPPPAAAPPPPRGSRSPCRRRSRRRLRRQRPPPNRPRSVRREWRSRVPRRPSPTPTGPRRSTGSSRNPADAELTGRPRGSLAREHPRPERQVQVLHPERT